MNDRAATVLDRLHPAEREALLALEQAFVDEFELDFVDMGLVGRRNLPGVGAPEMHVQTMFERIKEDTRRRAENAAARIGKTHGVSLRVHVFDCETWHAMLDRHPEAMERICEKRIPIEPVEAWTQPGREGMPDA